MAQLVRVLAGWARWLVPCLGSPVQSQAQSWLSWLERWLAGSARWLVPCLGSPVQSQAQSWLSWLERWLAGLGGWCHAWGPRFNPRPGLGSVG